MSEYQLEEKVSKERNVFILTIMADSNDADYITETVTYNKGKCDEILPALIDLRDNYSGSHSLENYPNEFDLPIPYNGYDGYCHSLEKLTVEHIDENSKIFDVKF